VYPRGSFQIRQRLHSTLTDPIIRWELQPNLRARKYVEFHDFRVGEALQNCWFSIHGLGFIACARKVAVALNAIDKDDSSWEQSAYRESH
jgi:hypothetical protein